MPNLRWYQSRDCLPKLGQSVRLRIAVIRAVERRLAQLFDYILRRGNVRIPDAEADDIYPLRPLLRNLSAYPHEQIRRNLLYAAGKFHLISINDCKLFFFPNASIGINWHMIAETS